MAEPCRQEVTIATLQGNDARLFDVLGRIEKNQERFIEVLEQIAAQGERINHLEVDVRRQEKDTNELFSRMREVENQPGKGAIKLTFGVILAVVSGVISYAVARMTGAH